MVCPSASSTIPGGKLFGLWVSEVVADDLVVAAAAVAALRLTGCHSDHGNGLHRSQAECKFHVS